jgi:vacuolar-type H+-ATPase subunit I/STV1
MNPKIITAALAAVVVCFAGIGTLTVKSVSENITASDREFALTSNVLSPLFDIYALEIVDGQAKASKALIDPKEFCASLTKLETEAERLIAEYNRHPELVAQHKLVKAYLKKAREMCDKNQIEALNSSAMTAELYAVIDPMTELINKLLLENLAVSRKYKDAADSALINFERFASVAAGLGIVFAVAPWIGNKPKSVKRKIKR